MHTSVKFEGRAQLIIISDKILSPDAIFQYGRKKCLIGGQ